MEDKQLMMQQLQSEMIIAKEDNNEDLYQKLLLIKEKLEKELDPDEKQ